MSDPDFIERNGTWVLSMLGVVSTFFGGLFAYLLKSRCTSIKCCCMECQRNVAPLEAPTPQPINTV